MGYTSRDLINIAAKRHAHIEALVSEMVNEVSKVNPAYTFEVAMHELEIVLQAVLLKSAVADGDFEGFEEFFIENTRKYADILTSINSELESFDSEWSCISWDDLYDMPSEDIELLARVGVKIAKGYADEFVTELARADKIIKEKNYLKMLNNDVIAIVLAFSGVDGDNIEGESAELEAFEGLKVYNELINLKWSEITGE